MNSIRPLSIHGAQLTRRGFLSTGGALIAAVHMPLSSAQAAERRGASLNATQPTSWIEIHADNTVLIRTGKCDFGQSSIYTAYPQIVAEELGFPFEAVTTVVSGDTDRTPDGGGTFGLLRTNVLNLRKVAAYLREAALELAAEKLGTPKPSLTIKDGVITGGGKSVTYGDLVTGQDLQLSIPLTGELTSFRGYVVAGDPPMKAVADYSVVGKSHRNTSLRPKMSGELPWVGDIKVPGMLHARVIHPKTLGSTLISAGALDKAAFPNSQIVAIDNLLAVLAPTEWEAIQAAQQVGYQTEWSDWNGLPGHENLYDYLRKDIAEQGVSAKPGSANAGDVKAGAERVSVTHEGSYQMPYMKHAPIGPTVSLAEFSADGSVTVHTHSQNPQHLRHMIALMLGEGEDKVVIRTYPGPGHYGRSNGGTAGSEDQAVLLAKAVGKPVRVQWMRDDDMQWSTQSNATVADIKIGLNEEGRIATYEADHYSPPMQDDRLLGAILAGLPTIASPYPDNPAVVHDAALRIADRWVYGTIPNVSETGHGTYQVGEQASPLRVGLRDHSMRTPIQFQQNFPREVAITEAAIRAGKDPLAFRMEHVDDLRFKDILVRLREETGWVARSSPSPQARAEGDQPVRGQGVSVMWRDNGFWGCAAYVQVTPSTGEVKVERIAVAVDPGIVVNPLQLNRQVQAGCLMGVSQALHEEVTFDEGAVTSTDWASYPILTMAEMPEVQVIINPRPDVGVYGQGSEGANALAASAVAGAFLDATGVPARRIPLRPDYVRSLLSA